MILLSTYYYFLSHSGQYIYRTRLSINPKSPDRDEINNYFGQVYTHFLASKKHDMEKLG